MKRTPLFFIALLPVLASARFTAQPSQTCEAYNNMKHTKNTHHVLLAPGHDYTVVKKHKGQYLILLKGESPAQRWADGSCFSGGKRTTAATKKPTPRKKYQKQIFPNTKKGGKTELLVLSWQNAFCETHRKKQECRQDKGGDAGHLTLHGLWPQPRSNAYCNVPKKTVSRDKFHQWRMLPNIDTNPETLELMDRYMPGYVSYLHKHEWIKHGTCYGTTADKYFHDGLTLAKEVDNSAVGKLLKNTIGKRVTLGVIRHAFDQAFGMGAGQRVEMKCNRGLLTELWINLRGQGEHIQPLITNAPKRKSRCRQARVDGK